MTEENQGIDFAKATTEELKAAGFTVKTRKPSKPRKFKPQGGTKAIRGQMGVGSLLTRKSSRGHQGPRGDPTHRAAERHEERGW